MTELVVRHAIVPILRLSSSGSVLELLGTGFFAAKHPYVVTAKHVFEDYPLKDNESFAMAYQDENGDVKFRVIKNYQTSPHFDIAVFAAGSIPNAIRLFISKDSIPENQDVLTCAFSTTRIEVINDKRVVKFQPYTHKGNVLSHYVSDFPEKIPTPVMDVSFPALQGASGAPIIRESDFAVVGMIVANHEMHLMPAQIVKIESDKIVEETKYFLPLGKAIEGKLILEFLVSRNEDISIVE
jgi:hypothetical protein